MQNDSGYCQELAPNSIINQLITTIIFKRMYSMYVFENFSLQQFLVEGGGGNIQ